jgi:hypothetical protein
MPRRSHPHSQALRGCLSARDLQINSKLGGGNWALEGESRWERLSHARSRRWPSPPHRHRHSCRRPLATASHDKTSSTTQQHLLLVYFARARRYLPGLSSGRCMILGADVTHPLGSGGGERSVAAVCGSLDGALTRCAPRSMGQLPEAVRCRACAGGQRIACGGGSQGGSLPRAWRTLAEEQSLAHVPHPDGRRWSTRMAAQPARQEVIEGMEAAVRGVLADYRAANGWGRWRLAGGVAGCGCCF